MGEAETIKIVDAFIQRWQGQEGGQERANYALFLTELCDLIGVEHPEPAGATHERNDYVFERVVTRHKDDGDTLGSSSTRKMPTPTPTAAALTSTKATSRRGRQPCFARTSFREILTP